MAQSQWYTLQATDKQAAERQTALAGSSVRLYKSSFVPNATTTKVELVAAEANYDAYAPIPITAFLGPVLAPGSGFMILSPQVLFECGDTDPVVGNAIGGFWLEDSTGVVRMVGRFETALPMSLSGQSVPLNIYDLFGTGYVG